ncbi:hypothetical protein EJ419_02800 [Alloscardovia theropitheci]|uniref:ParA family protein n=1 Tax=Alloscardovia theropitheci TaxID=2496842 RepID=A0A4R0QTF6_9BIFI|nr:hypothetical protein [Alloscardovia theropitheci]TCD54545.1 hypothetical protein EJ419_02800 [Alloscardovia theropitheci]
MPHTDRSNTPRAYDTQENRYYMPSRELDIDTHTADYSTVPLNSTVPLSSTMPLNSEGHSRISTNGQESSSPDDSNNSRRRNRARNTRVINSVTLVCVLACDGGDGASTFALQIARAYSDNGYSVCLVDLDFRHGGLDVVAGCEELEGLRWHNIQAPLGHIDARDFDNDMIHWDSVAVLPSHPWHAEGKSKQWWEIKAVYEALCHNYDVIVCDCAQGITDEVITAWNALNTPIRVIPVILMRLDTLSISRCSSLLDTIKSHSDELHCEEPIALTVQKSKNRVHEISDYEAEKYLNICIHGELEYKRKIEEYAMHGWGVPALSRRQRALFNSFIRKTLQQNHLE